MKRHPRGYRYPGPDHDAQAVQQQERRPAEPHCARERRRDGGQARDELRQHERQSPPALKANLRLPHAGIGRERHAAQQLHHAAAVAPAGDVPERVADAARNERDAEYRPGRKLSLGRQRAGDDQRRGRGNRQADLLQQHVRENERQPVLRDQAIHMFPLTRP